MVPHNNLGLDLNGKAVNETQYKDISNLKNPPYVVKGIFRYLKAMSSAKAEYVAAAGYYANILWMKSQLTNYDVIYEKVPIFCDNISVIAISNNQVMHSRTKHIDIRYQFIRDDILNGGIELHFILTQYQLDDIFTKPLDEPTFKIFIVKLGGILEEVGVNTFMNAIGAHYLSYSSEYVAPPFIKTVRQWFSTIGYEEAVKANRTLKKSLLPPSLVNGVNIDYAKQIWEDIVTKLNKKTREKIVPHTRFLSLLLEHKMKGYGNDNVTLNPTQVFNVHNWALKKNQPEGPAFTDQILAICNADVSVEHKAPYTSSYSRKTEFKAKILE
ncbi:hypothetical protein Tco_0639623 [Tanacetum coccineum]